MARRSEKFVWIFSAIFVRLKELKHRWKRFRLADDGIHNLRWQNFQLLRQLFIRRDSRCIQSFVSVSRHERSLDTHEANRITTRQNPSGEAIKNASEKLVRVRNRLEFDAFSFFEFFVHIQISSKEKLRQLFMIRAIIYRVPLPCFLKQ